MRVSSRAVSTKGAIALRCFPTEDVRNNLSKIRQDGRLPPTFFVPSHFGRKATSKDGSAFFQHNLFFHRFSKISNLKNFLFFLPKKLTSRVDRQF